MSSNEKKNENGKLEWNPDIDFGLDKVNITCEDRKDEIETSIQERQVKNQPDESEFVKVKRSITILSNCKPRMKNERTIDTKQRLHVNQLTSYSEQVIQKLDIKDESLDIDTKLGIREARLQRLENLLQNTTDSNKKTKYESEKTQLTDDITRLTKEKEAKYQ